MSRQRSSGKKGADAPQPPTMPSSMMPPQQPTTTPQQPMGMPPGGRMSMAQLKKMGVKAAPPTPTIPQQQQQQQSIQSQQTQMNSGFSIASMSIQKSKVDEDGRAIPQNKSIKGHDKTLLMSPGPAAPTGIATPNKLGKKKMSTDDTDEGVTNPTNSSQTPSKPVKQLQPLPLYTHPATLLVNFDKFLKIDKNTTISGQILSYPIIGLNQFDACKLGLMINDLVVVSLIDPQHDENTNHASTLPSTSFLSPTKPTRNDSFKHQHPSLLSTPMSNLNTPNTKKSLNTAAPTPALSKQSNPLVTVPSGTHHHICICRVQTFGAIERGQFRVDYQFKSMLHYLPLYTQFALQRLFPDRPVKPSLLNEHDHQSAMLLQNMTMAGSKRDDLERSFLSDHFVYLTKISHSSQFINNSNTSVANSMYPQTNIIPVNMINIAKNNIFLSSQQELAYNITQQKQLLSQSNNNSSQTTQSNSEETNTSKSSTIQHQTIPTQMSTALDSALASALTNITSNFVFILPNVPICTSLCGVVKPYYPYNFTTPYDNITDQTLNQSNNNIDGTTNNIITVYATTPQTLIHITLGKRTIATKPKNTQNPSIKNSPVPPPSSSTPEAALSSSTSNVAIAGLDQEMKILSETLELPLKQPTLFSSFGLKAPKGVLLHGPPGCGKTLLAHWFSQHTSAQFIPLTATNILSRGGANYLYQLFTSLSTTQRGGANTTLSTINPNMNNINPTLTQDGKIPIIIFIDEIDGLCSDNTIICALLSLLDGGHDQYNNICILGATNRPNVLPPALRRPGRFDVELNITPPSIQAREEILKIKLTKNQILHSLSTTDITSIAEHANGFVGADIDLLISEAVSHSVLASYRKQQEEIFQHDEDTDGDNYNIDYDDEKQQVHQNPPTPSTQPLQLDDFRYALQVVRPSGLRDYSAISVTDSQVGGHNVIKQRLEEAFEWPLRHAALVDMLGARKNSGILLFGPPGCAKTLLAKSICARSRRTFLCVKGPELFSKYVGDSEKAVKAVFQRARACAPCILFLDEVDSFGAARGGSSGGGSDATDRVVSQLLVEMDGISDRGDVCILAATNRPDMVDRALLRAGRLDRSLYVGPPQLDEIDSILRINLKKMNCENGLFDHLANFSQQCFTKQHTGAELAAICRDAGVRALTRFIVQQETKMIQMKADLSNNVEITQELFLAMIEDAQDDNDINNTTSMNNNNANVNDKDVCVTIKDLQDAIDDAVPRITPNMIQFYLDYQQKHGLTNL